MKKLLLIPAVLLLTHAPAFILHADNLMLNGGFEEPAVKTRSTMELGGNPVANEATSKWKTFEILAQPAAGKVVAGLTNEISHEGAQSLYVEYGNVSIGSQIIQLRTRLIGIMPEAPYRINLWGKLDKKTPFVIGERTLFLKMEVNYFMDDGVTPAGESDYRIQPIPGSKNRPPVFTAEKWNEYFVEVKSPPGAAFMVFTLKFENGSQPGKTTGIIFIDDFSISGNPGVLQTPLARPSTPPAEENETPAEMTTGTDS